MADTSETPPKPQTSWYHGSDGILYNLSPGVAKLLEPHLTLYPIAPERLWVFAYSAKVKV